MCVCVWVCVWVWVWVWVWVGVWRVACGVWRMGVRVCVCVCVCVKPNPAPLQPQTMCRYPCLQVSPSCVRLCSAMDSKSH